MDLLSLHAIGFDFEISEDTMSGCVQMEEATMNKAYMISTGQLE